MLIAFFEHMDSVQYACAHSGWLFVHMYILLVLYVSKLTEKTKFMCLHDFGSSGCLTYIHTNHNGNLQPKQALIRRPKACFFRQWEFITPEKPMGASTSHVCHGGCSDPHMFSLLDLRAYFPQGQLVKLLAFALPTDVSNFIACLKTGCQGNVPHHKSTLSTHNIYIPVTTRRWDRKKRPPNSFQDIFEGDRAGVWSHCMVHWHLRL